MKQVTIKTLPEAVKLIKEMNPASDEWTGDYRPIPMFPSSAAGLIRCGTL